MGQCQNGGNDLAIENAVLACPSRRRERGGSHMKRSGLALLAAIALGAAFAGPVAAIPIPGTLDQSNAVSTSPDITFASGAPMSQTFTAGKSGLLTVVRLWADHTTPFRVEVEGTTAGKPNGDSYGTSNQGTPTNTAGWVTFDFPSAVPVNANTMYALVFNAGAGADAAYGSGDTYSGGQASIFLGGIWTVIDRSPSPNLLDFGFQTYVAEQTATLAWDKTSITAGASTSLKLTETLVFPAFTAPSVVRPALGPAFSVKSDVLPSWFSVTGITCSAQVLPADCIKANVAPGSSIPVTLDGNPIVLTLTGTATPAAAGASSGKAEACGTYPIFVLNIAGQAGPAAANPTVCVSAEAAINAVAVVPTQAPTLPPTSADGSTSNPGPGFALWLLPFCIVAGAGAALFLSRRHASLR
jgi:hypothetical protein